jgi:lysyl-tRNA synthetase class 2
MGNESRNRRILVADEIFELFPNFYRGIVIVKDVTIHKSYKPIRRLLRGQVEARMAIDVAADGRISAWDDAHRKFGSDPSLHPPSIRSLLERVRGNQNVPFINSVVALFNTISLKYVLPCGGDDIERTAGNLVLGLAEGSERFLALGSDREAPPIPGEVIYYDDATKNVLCRRWNWRNGERTKIDVGTRRLVINIDGLPPTTPEVVHEARDELTNLLREHCGADLEASALHSNQRQVEIPLTG